MQKGVVVSPLLRPLASSWPEVRLSAGWSRALPRRILRGRPHPPPSSCPLPPTLPQETASPDHVSWRLFGQGWTNCLAIITERQDHRGMTSVLWLLRRVSMYPLCFQGQGNRERTGGRVLMVPSGRREDGLSFVSQGEVTGDRSSAGALHPCA